MSKKTECMQGGFAASYTPQFEGLACVQGATPTEMDTSGLDRDLGSRGSDWFEGTEQKRHPEITPRTGAPPRICHIMARSLDFRDLVLNLGFSRWMYFSKLISIPETQFYQLVGWGECYQSDRVTLRTLWLCVWVSVCMSVPIKHSAWLQLLNKRQLILFVRLGHFVQYSSFLQGCFSFPIHFNLSYWQNPRWKLS